MFDHMQGPDPSTDRRMQRLARVASDLATGATTVEELGHRLRDNPEVRVARNVLLTPGDSIGHPDGNQTAPNGGIIPAP